MLQLSKGNATYISTQWQILMQLQHLAHFPAVLMNAACPARFCTCSPCCRLVQEGVGGLDLPALTLHYDSVATMWPLRRK